ncbi:hypothetical protein [Nocardiopsis lucentensis]|uniref:hypothetical protein n=1 Tax=Nocardiopsis lucentensis TaxID=53441 RepID=UPI0003486769|nr:hypothetical protein [Nocardiopsis lucentensis]
MTTTAPEFTSLAARDDVHLPLTLTALSAISHGAGTSGNTQLLRTRDVIAPDGRRAAVPYVSGNSLRHTLRAALAWHLVRTLDVPDRSLAKRTVDLLWSGGALSTTGSQADLDLNRRVHQLLPGLGLLGYSAKSDITAGTLWVDDVELVCAENANRLPARLADHPHAALPNGALRTETFGTRHDTVTTAADRFIALAEDTLDSTIDTVQMIYDMQVIKPGATLYTGLHLATPTEGHVAAFYTALDEAAPKTDRRRLLNLGGKRSTGYGQCAVDTPTEVETTISVRRDAYEAHLVDNRTEVLELLDEVTR